MRKFERQIRDVREGDERFILSSWAKSYWNALRPAEKDEAYWPAQKEIIIALLGSSVVLVACDAEDPDAIFGYAVGEPRREQLLLHYVYVKQAYRNDKIARDLVEALGKRHSMSATAEAPRSVVVTHVTTGTLAQMARSRGWGFAQNLPYYRALAARRSAA